ncbi:MAG: SDR family NAD(P)-dependent oxidoreductase [Desulfosudaceae bacterium]
MLYFFDNDFRRTAIITGGGRGLGRSAAIAMAREGAAVAITSRMVGELDETAARIKATGGKVLVVPGDVSDTGHATVFCAIKYIIHRIVPAG